MVERLLQKTKTTEKAGTNLLISSKFHIRHKTKNRQRIPLPFVYSASWSIVNVDILVHDCSVGRLDLIIMRDWNLRQLYLNSVRNLNHPYFTGIACFGSLFGNGPSTVHGMPTFSSSSRKRLTYLSVFKSCMKPT